MESAEREIQTLGEGGQLAYTKGPSAPLNISVVGITQLLRFTSLWHNFFFGIIHTSV